VSKAEVFDRNTKFILDESFFTCDCKGVKDIIHFGNTKNITFYVLKSVLREVVKKISDELKTLLYGYLSHNKVIPVESLNNINENHSYRSLIVYTNLEAVTFPDYRDIYNLYLPPDGSYYDLKNIPNGAIQIKFVVEDISRKIQSIILKANNEEIQSEKNGSSFKFSHRFDNTDITKSSICLSANVRNRPNIIIQTPFTANLMTGGLLYITCSRNQYSISQTRPIETPIIGAIQNNKIIELPAKIELPDAYLNALRDNPSSLRLSTDKSATDKVLALGSKLNEGGEGCIYHLNGSKCLLKLYNKDIYVGLENKLLKLISCRQLVENQNISAPQKLVYYDGVFVGYVMRKVQGEAMHILNYALLKKEQKIKDRTTLVNIAINYINSVQKVHENNVLLVDINDNNILLDLTNNMISLVDIDSAQVESFPCLVGIDDYLSKNMQELQKNSLNSKKHALSSLSDEIFSIYVFVFKIIMGGKHPYDHKGMPTDQHKNVTANFVYPRSPGGDISKIPGKAFPMLWQNLTSNVTEEFYHAFAENKRDLSRLKKVLEEYKEFLQKNPSKDQLFFQGS